MTIKVKHMATFFLYLCIQFWQRSVMD